MKTIQINNKHYEECDVVILPKDIETCEPRNCVGKIFINKDKVVSQLFDIEDIIKSHTYFGAKPYELYIISSEEIKEGDWVLCNNNIKQINSNNIADKFIENWKKIIATTDSSLKLYEGEIVEESSGFKLKIKNIYLPQIPQAFIEYFISEYNKGKIVDKVLVKVEEKNEYISPLEVIPPATPGVYVTGYKLKLNQNNEISILNNNPLFDNNDIEAAKKYIGLPLNKEMDEEERYYNSRHREYDAFLAGIAYAKSKANNLK
jgi:hypothetical protein